MGLGTRIQLAIAVAALLAGLIVFLIPKAFWQAINFPIVYVPFFFIAFWLAFSIGAFWILVYTDVPERVLLKYQWLKLTTFGMGLCVGSPLSAAFYYSKETGVIVDYSNVNSLYVIGLFLIVCAISRYFFEQFKSAG